jgi:hypothetical protein
VVIRSGTFPFCISFFCSQSEKRNTDEMASTLLPQAKQHVKCDRVSPADEESNA